MLAVAQKQKNSFTCVDSDNSRPFGYDKSPQYLSLVRSVVAESKNQIATGRYVSSLNEFFSIMEKKNPSVWK